MQYGSLTREQAIEAVGEEVMAQLDMEECFPTDRVQPDGDDSIEYRATIRVSGNEFVERISAYFYLDPETVENSEPSMFDVNWDKAFAGYEIN